MHLDSLPASHPSLTTSLPFVVRPATCLADLRKVTQMRAEAYGRHLPAFAAGLRAIEAADRAAGAVVLVVESKHDRRPVGTVRLQMDHDHPLPVEASVRLPAWLRGGGPLVEPTRLCVEASAHGALARNALFKACYLYAAASGAAWIVAAARRPLDRLYTRLLFRDVFEGGEAMPMRHIGNLPHRVLALPVREARALAIAQRHPLAEFLFATEHPDVIVAAMPLRAPSPMAA